MKTIHHIFLSSFLILMGSSVVTHSAHLVDVMSKASAHAPDVTKKVGDDFAKKVIEGGHNHVNHITGSSISKAQGEVVVAHVRRNYAQVFEDHHELKQSLFDKWWMTMRFNVAAIIGMIPTPVLVPVPVTHK